MPTAPTEIIDALQASIRLHWTKIESLETQGIHLHRWGYRSLGKRVRREADEEREHLAALVKRLEYFDVGASFVHPFPSWPRHDVPGMLAYNLDCQRQAAELEKANLLVCRSFGDERSAKVFAELLEGSERSIKRIESDQKLIDQIGAQSWLSSQMD
jgi:bacterioferritin (cytochrome b1)